MQTVYVEGIAELNKKFEMFSNLFQGPEIQKIAMDAAAIMGKATRRRAPLGPTGNLRRSINWFKGIKASKFGAAAVMKVRVPKGGKFRAGTAPHAYWVEFGIPGDRLPKGKALRIPLSKIGARGSGTRARIAGRYGFAFAKRVGPMPAAHFFSQGVDESADKARDAMIVGARTLAERAGR